MQCGHWKRVVTLCPWGTSGSCRSSVAGTDSRMWQRQAAHVAWPHSSTATLASDRLDHFSRQMGHWLSVSPFHENPELSSSMPPRTSCAVSAAATASSSPASVSR